jgi:hypothetical protein
VVVVASAGHADVKAFAGGGGVGDEVGGVGGDALGAVDGGGVAEFDVSFDVRGGQDDGADGGFGGVVEADGECSVGEDVVDAPALPVADIPVGASTVPSGVGMWSGAVGEVAVDLAGEDGVAASGVAAIGEGDNAVGVDGSNGDEVVLGALA